MRPNRLFGLCAISVTQVAALKLPFNIPFFSNNDQAPLIDINALLPSSTPPNRVAIIGAGAAGSSAAFWIAKAKERFGLDIGVDVYEKSDYIGGRMFYLAGDIYYLTGLTHTPCGQEVRSSTRTITRSTSRSS